MKRISIFGSTGSIGKNTLNVIRKLPGKFKVIGLSTNSDIDTLCSQVKEFSPSYVCVSDLRSAVRIKRIIGSKIKIFSGSEGLDEFASDTKVDMSVFAISGSAALSPLIAAIKSRHDIALANKEALVMSGNFIMSLAREKKIRIIPVDSEQSAIWQCLCAGKARELKQVYLTASGGPLLRKTKRYLEKVTVSEVLNHPRWKMGKKITVDSATLMNKGLEFLEAMFLFNIAYDKIKVLIHPQALVHSMVEFIDGVIIAQISATDMRVPIQYALCYPDRMAGPLPRLDFYKIKELNFSIPDTGKFPCLRLAYQAARELGTLPAVMNAANEVAVEGFLRGKLRFVGICEVVSKVMRRHKNCLSPDLNGIKNSDSWARQEAIKIISRGGCN